MIQTFTLDDLTKYLYGEVTEKEGKDIARALAEDDELREQYDEMVTVKKQLEQTQFDSSKACTDRILSYARECNKQEAE